MLKTFFFWIYFEWFLPNTGGHLPNSINAAFKTVQRFRKDWHYA